MEINDGFVSGIYNYCDSWCERCDYTRWCRVFADSAEAEARLDPNLKAVLEAPPLPDEIPPPPSREMRELIEAMNAAAAGVSVEKLKPVRPELERRDHPLAARAMSYCLAVHTWLEANHASRPTDPASPINVISWYSTCVPAKIRRALHGLAWLEADELKDVRDHDGSAKVALIGLARSHAAWLQLVESRVAGPAEADPFIADLVWLTDELERMFPRARAFVRPVFDEPEAAARLLDDNPVAVPTRVPGHHHAPADLPHADAAAGRTRPGRCLVRVPVADPACRRRRLPCALPHHRSSGTRDRSPCARRADRRALPDAWRSRTVDRRPRFLELSNLARQESARRRALTAPQASRWSRASRSLSRHRKVNAAGSGTRAHREAVLDLERLQVPRSPRRCWTRDSASTSSADPGQHHHVSTVLADSEHPFHFVRGRVIAADGLEALGCAQRPPAPRSRGRDTTGRAEWRAGSLHLRPPWRIIASRFHARARLI